MSEERPVSRRGFLRAATAGAAVAGVSTTATAQEDGGDGGGGGGGSVTVDLVDYAYEPGTEQPLYISPGTTVNFVWVTSTHNIVIDSQPSDAGWEGHEPIEDAGFEYSHTFETLGEYEFHCQPHLANGMEGTIVVNEQGAPPAPEGGEPAVPESAKALGVAATAAMAGVLGLVYVFLKYGGGGNAESSD